MGENSLVKSFPQNLDAERAVLGGVIIENEAIGRVLEQIRPEDFYREAHRKIFAVMVELYQDSAPIDLVTVSDALSANNQLEEIGGLAFLSSLPDSVPVTTNLASYARIIREKAVLRRLLEAATDISERVLESEGSFRELLDFAEKSIFDISEFKASQAFTPVGKILESTFAHIQQLYERKESITGLPTGLVGIDRMLAGLQPSDLIIVAARPSMGKTAFALNICQHVALHGHVPAAIFSLEMSKEQLVLRLLTSEAKVDASKVRTGMLNDDDWQKLVTGAEHLYEAPIYIDDTPGITIHELRAKVRHLRAEHDIGLVVVDYLQLMSGSGRVNSREQEISEISRGLKAIAKELKLPVVALSQLNRSLESRTDKRPLMSDLRESGAIEQDADVIMFIYREVVYHRKETEEELDEELKRKAEIIIGKQRNGPTGTVRLVFLGEYSSFVNPVDEFREEY